MFESTGILKYFDNKLIVEVDQNIVDFYLSLIPKHLYVNRQRHAAHISVVRKEVSPNIEFWRKYEGEQVSFLYDNIIHNGTVYFWLNVFSKKLEDIREELGLENKSTFQPPDNWKRIFHITLGNTKNDL